MFFHTHKKHLPAAPTPLQHLAVVMEYVGGGNLQQYVEGQGRLPEWQARCFFQQLILALQVGEGSLCVWKGGQAAAAAGLFAGRAQQAGAAAVA